jgi:hypothetical protein
MSEQPEQIFTEAQIAEERSRYLQEQSEKSKDNHYSDGVGGWLLCFIFTLVFFSPAVRVWDFVAGYHQTMGNIAHIQRHPYSLYQLYFVEQLVAFALSGYGIIVGIRLWNVQPGASGKLSNFYWLSCCSHSQIMQWEPSGQL